MRCTTISYFFSLFIKYIQSLFTNKNVAICILIFLISIVNIFWVASIQHQSSADRTTKRGYYDNKYYDYEVPQSDSNSNFSGSEGQSYKSKVSTSTGSGQDLSHNLSNMSAVNSTTSSSSEDDNNNNNNSYYYYYDNDNGYYQYNYDNDNSYYKGKTFSSSFTTHEHNHQQQEQQQQVEPVGLKPTSNFLDEIDVIISSKLETLLQQQHDNNNNSNNNDHNDNNKERRGPLKFYMYQHPNLTLSDPSLWPLGYRNRAAFKLCTDEIYFDESMFVVLERSSRRTMDPEEAHVIIIPIPMGRIFSAKNSTEFWDLSFSTLVQEPLFLQHHGHRHVLIATGFPLFKNRILPLMAHYPKLYNVTLVQSWDPNGVAKAIQDGTGYEMFHEYRPYFEQFTPVSRSSISLGLGTKPDSAAVPIPDFLKYPAVVNIPLTIPTMDHWRNASNFIFYHTRTAPSQWNSTIYRHVPVTNITMSHLPPSSIGWDMNVKEWLREYVDSKFCLVIRGDSPHSKAFVRSVRAGCIPVVIADCLPVYAPVFKSILNMSDYAIILDEKTFVEDPEGELLKLLDLTEEEIQGKIQHLAFAQRIMMMDHPESLFVEAFLYEAVQTFKSS